LAEGADNVAASARFDWEFSVQPKLSAGSFTVCAMRIVAALLASVVAAGGVVAMVPAEAQSPVAARSAKHVTLTAPADAVEGDRYTVTVHVPSPKNAIAATLEYQKTGTSWIDSESEWTALKSMNARGHGTLKFHVQADTAREYKFRAKVTYRGSKRASISAAKRVNYWHWAGLPANYYSVGSGFDYHDFVGFSMAGRSAKGWFLDLGLSAEDRYTLPGRCRSFHANVGLADGSADGSAGTITFSTIDSSGIPKPIWKSPTLVPGKTAPVTLTLASPYRFSVLGQNTSTPVTSGTTTTIPVAQPAVSDPEFLCHVD